MKFTQEHDQIFVKNFLIIALINFFFCSLFSNEHNYFKKNYFSKKKNFEEIHIFKKFITPHFH